MRRSAYLEVRETLQRIVQQARAEGVPVLVDACQAMAHLPISMHGLSEPDALVFSGHKVYAPGSPGVLLIRHDLVASDR